MRRAVRYGSFALVVAAYTLISGCASSPDADPRRELPYTNNLASEQISAQLQSQHRYFEQCKQVYGDPALQGTLTVRFRVRADGSTMLPHVFESIGQSAALDRCLNEAALRLHFSPMPSGMVAEVDYPVHFSRQSRLPASQRHHLNASP